MTHISLAAKALTLGIAGISVLLWFGHWDILLGVFLLMWGDKVADHAIKKQREEQDPIGNLLKEWEKQDARKRS